MAKPDKIDLIFQLILAICDFGVAETPSFDLRKFFSTRNFHQKFFSTSGEDVQRVALFHSILIKIFNWPHERSTFLKKMTLNGHFSRPAETDPYIHDACIHDAFFHDTCIHDACIHDP